MLKTQTTVFINDGTRNSQFLVRFATCCIVFLFVFLTQKEMKMHFLFFLKRVGKDTVPTVTSLERRERHLEMQKRTARDQILTWQMFQAGIYTYFYRNVKKERERVSEADF